MAGTHTIVRLVSSAKSSAAFVLKVSSPREAFVYRHRDSLGLDGVLPFGRALTVEQCDRLLGANDKTTVSGLFDHDPALTRAWSSRRNKKIAGEAIDNRILRIESIDGKEIPYKRIRSEISSGNNTAILMENLFEGTPKSRGDYHSLDIKIGFLTKSEIQYKYENPGKFKLTILFKLIEHWIKDTSKNSRRFGFDASFRDILDLLDFVDRRDVVGDQDRHLLVQQIASAIAGIEAAVAASPVALVGASINIILAKPRTGERYVGPIVCLIDPDHPILNLHTEPPPPDDGRERPEALRELDEEARKRRDDLHDEAAAACVVTDRNWTTDPRLKTIVKGKIFPDWIRKRKQEGFIPGVRNLANFFRKISERQQQELEKALGAGRRSADFVVTVFEMPPEEEREFRKEQASRRAVANRPKRSPSDGGGRRSDDGAPPPSRRQSAVPKLQAAPPPAEAINVPLAAAKRARAEAAARARAPTEKRKKGRADQRDPLVGDSGKMANAGAVGGEPRLAAPDPSSAPGQPGQEGARDRASTVKVKRPRAPTQKIDRSRAGQARVEPVRPRVEDEQEDVRDRAPTVKIDKRAARQQRQAADEAQQVTANEKARADKIPRTASEQASVPGEPGQEGVRGRISTLKIDRSRANRAALEPMQAGLDPDAPAGGGDLPPRRAR